jgi:hypothetical protein
MEYDDSIDDSNYRKAYERQVESTTDHEAQVYLAKMRFSAIGVVWLFNAVLTAFVGYVLLDSIEPAQQVNRLQYEQIQDDPSIPARAKQGMLKTVQAGMELVIEFYYWLAALCFVLGFISLCAGIRLIQFRGVGMAIAASVLGCIPISPTWIYTMPAAVWTFVTLSNADTKAAYHRYRNRSKLHSM